MRVGLTILAMLLCIAPAPAQAEDPTVRFRRGNENASRSRWEEAMLEYGQLAKEGVRAPALYWNWAQAAAASGKKGEAFWALLRAQDLEARDSTISRELERLRGELGLDPSEVSLGLWGDTRRLARRLRFDGLAIAAFALSLIATMGGKPRASLSLLMFLIGLVLVCPFLVAPFRDSRGVVVQKDAPLVDVPRDNAVALSNLREGEVVPILGEEGAYVRIQDASGARGFALKSDVRRIGIE